MTLFSLRNLGFVVAPALVTIACVGNDFVLGYSEVSASGGGGAPGTGGSIAPGGANAGGAGGAAFGSIELVEALTSTTNQDDPSMTADRLELFFASKRDGGVGREDIWVVTRASAADPWGEPTLIGAANSVERETAVAVAPDGLSLWFASDRADSVGALDVWRSVRSTRTEEFGAAEHVLELSTEENDLPRAPNETGTFLPLSRPSAEGDTDLFLIPLSAGPTYGTPIALSTLNTLANESDATLSADGLTIIFASDRDDSDGDLYLSTRPSLAAEFRSPVPLEELNTPYEESDPWLSGDGRLILWSSRKTGQLEVYQAVR